MDKQFSVRLDDIAFDCDNALKMGNFYAELLGWNKIVHNDYCVSMISPEQNIRFLFVKEDDFVPPVWPEKEGTQQKMLHLDFTVSDLKSAVHHAISCGAIVATTQYRPEQ